MAVDGLTVLLWAVTAVTAVTTVSAMEGNVTRWTSFFFVTRKRKNFNFSCRNNLLLCHVGGTFFFLSWI